MNKQISPKLDNILSKSLLDYNAFYEGYKGDISYLSIALDNPKFISYLNQDRYDKISPCPWDDHKRKSIAYMGKVGKTLKKFSSYDISSNEIEKIMSHLTVGDKYTFKLVNEDNIRYYYHEEQYCNENNGTLDGSCMKHQSCQEYLDCFTESPCVQLLVLIDEDTDKISGRSIVWKQENGVLLMDRIYGTEITIERFKEYASENGMMHKKEQNYNNNTFLNPSKNMEVYSPQNRFEVGTHSTMPYMDTYKYYNRDEGFLYYRSSSYCETMDDTNGNDEEGSVCYDCECRIDEDYMCHNDNGDSFCEDCFSERYVYNENGETINRDEAVEINGYYHHEEECTCCTECNSNILTNDSMYSESTCESYCEDCFSETHVYSEFESEDILLEDATQIDDEWFKTCDCVETESDGMQLIDNCVETERVYNEQGTDFTRIMELEDNCTELDGKWVLTESLELTTI